MKNNALKFLWFLSLIFALVIYSLYSSSSYALSPKSIFAKYEKYGAVVLNKKITAVLNHKYQLKIYETKSIMVLNQRGINNFSEVVLPFSLKYQKIKLLYGYSLLRGMFKVPLGKHAVNIVSPSYAVNNPAYSSIKYLTLSMPAVEAGSVINFSYELNYFKPVIKKGVFYTDYLSGSVPVKKGSFALIYPADMKINIYVNRLKNSALNKKNITIKGKKYIQISLALKDIKAIKKESFMPPTENYEKYISFSTYASWKKLLAVLNRKFVKSEKSDKNIANFALSAIGNLKVSKKTAKEKAALIYGKFVKAFRYQGMGYGINGYSPAAAPKTFSLGSGDSKSLAALLITMFKDAGIDAHPVLVNSLNSQKLVSGYVSPMQFDSVIVAANFDGHYFYFYPDSSSYKAFSLPFALSGRTAVVLLPNYNYKFITLPSQTVDENEKIYKFTGRLSKNGELKGLVTVVYKGIYGNYKRTSLKNESQYDIKNNIYDFLYNFVPGADVERFSYDNLKNVDKNLILRIKFRDNNYGRKKGDIILLHQIMPYDARLMNLTVKNKRLYPLVVGYPFKHISKIRIVFPKNSDIYYIPKNLNMTDNVGSASANCNYKIGDHTLTCNYQFESKFYKIPRKDYMQYKNLIGSYLGYLKNYFIAISSIYFY